MLIPRHDQWTPPQRTCAICRAGMKTRVIQDHVNTGAPTIDYHCTRCDLVESFTREELMAIAARKAFRAS